VDAREAVWEDTRAVDPETGLKYGFWKDDKWSTSDWSPQLFNELKEMIAEQVPDGAMRRDALTRIERSLDPDPTKALEGEDDMAKVWRDLAISSPATETYEKSLAAILQKTGCVKDEAPYVLRGLLRDFRNGVAFF